MIECVVPRKMASRRITTVLVVTIVTVKKGGHRVRDI